MSVADYGPSSQTLTFLDPEDDLGSLGIGADTQVRCPTAVYCYKTQSELCRIDAPKVSIDNFRAMATISTTRCLVSLSIWRNHLGQDYFDRNEIGLYKQTSLHVTHQVQASDP